MIDVNHSQALYIVKPGNKKDGGSRCARCAADEQKYRPLAGE
jgi:hypothetical protein